MVYALIFKKIININYLHVEENIFTTNISTSDTEFILREIMFLMVNFGDNS